MDSAGATLAILVAGVLVVVGGVLFLRLHAFLALLLGALLVGVLTPAGSIEGYSLQREASKVVSAGAGEATLSLTEKQGGRIGLLYQVVRRSPADGRWTSVGELQIDRFVEAPNTKGEMVQQAVAAVRGAGWQPQAGDLAVQPAVLAAAQKLATQNVAQRVAAGFGATCANIGILIALASIVGMCLLKSGAADRIVRSSLRLTGEKGAPGAFLGSSFLLGVPVFFDTVFYLMIPLAKAMALRTGRNYLLFVLTVVAGGAMAHTLVPPTPGPLLVAEQLKVPVGEMILAGMVVGSIAATAGYLFAAFLNRKYQLPLRDSADLSLKELEELSQRGDSKLPPTWLSMLPIALPVVLMGGYTLLQTFGWQPSPAVKPWADTLGDKNISLLIAAAIAMGTLVWKQRTSREEMAESLESAISSAGSVILITAAGGAFGAVLQQTGVAGLISQMPRSSPVVLLTLAFLVSSAIRTAQGSSTVAMITTAGVFAGMAGQSLGFHPVYLALTIGCGALPIGWMNDSGFWVVTKMSGMTEMEGLRYVTTVLAVIGVTGFLVTLVAATLFPMAM
ncbi:MAG: GntP family permease [Armatimonadota bacterium]